MLPKISAIVNADNDIKSKESMLSRVKLNFPIAADPIVPITIPVKVPIELKTSRVINLPITISFFEIGIIIAYFVQSELSSKLKVVTIIIQHNIAHINI